MAVKDQGMVRGELGLIIADNVSAMLAYWDKDLVCRFANSAYLDWFGKTREEMVDKMSMKDLLGSIFPQNKPYALATLAGTPQTFERAIPMPTGEGVRYALVNFFPHVVDGIVVGIIAHSADVTAIKLLEQQVELSNRTINQQNKSLLNFANIVTHNLRSYAGNLKMMLELYENEKDETQRQIIFEFLKEVSAGFSSSVDNLSDVVRVQNLSDLPMQQLCLHTYINKATDVLRAEITQTGAQIHNFVPPDVYIDAIPAFLESIILNFLTNAIKYRHPGRTPEVLLYAFIIGDETVLHIKDNGIGIDLEKHREKLYGMYQTFHANTDATGIGLFITKYQIDSMGGHIGVESEVGKGTEFRIYFKTKNNKKAIIPSA